MKVWEIYDGERHWFIAEDAEQARKFYHEIYGVDAVEIESIEEFPGNKDLKIHEHFDPVSFPGIQDCTKTADEWLACSDPGMLCSSVW